MKNLTNWRSFSIAKKIYLCLGIIIVAYVASMTFLLNEHHVEQKRLEAVSDSYFPASLLSQSAKNSFLQLIKAYEDAVTTGQPSLLKVADQHKKAILADISKLSDIAPSGKPAVQALSGKLQEYTKKAQPNYDIMASGRTVPIETAKALTTEAQSLRLQFETNAAGYSELLKTEISSINIEARRVLMITVGLFLILAVPALIIVTLVLAGIVRKLNATVERIRYVALGEGSINTRLNEALSKGDAGQEPMSSGIIDEIYLLSQSFDQMATELRSSFHQQNILLNDLNERNEELTATEEELRDQLDATLAAQKALKESEGKFRVVFDHSPAIISLTRLSDGVICEANQACIESLGYERDDIIGSSTTQVGALVDPDDRHKILDALKRFGEIREMPTILKKKDGVDINVLLSSEVIELDGVRYSLNVLQDVTQRLKLEEHLRQQQKLEGIGMLAGGMAHDINNLLTPIFLLTEMVSRKIPEEQSGRKHLASVHEAALKIKSLVSQVLMFSRKQRAELKPLDLNFVVTNFMGMLRRTIRESITIDLRASTKPCGVMADDTQLEQILMNLAVNAQDAIEGAGKIVVETGLLVLDSEYCSCYPGVEPGRYVMLAFSDSGCGMDEETLFKIFEPFYTTKPIGKGTGLGLSTVYGIVRQHGGHLDVLSAIGSGTTFRIFLPVLDTFAGHFAGKSSGNLQHDTPFTGTLLLVEDNTMLSDSIREALIENGVHTIVASSPREALDIFEERGTDIRFLLTDIVMPEMNGLELYRKLQGVRTDLKVLFMSGYTSDIDQYEELTSNPAIFLPKPFTIQNLVQKLTEAGRQ
ncbi:MAG: ATP-binding protein [Desulfuromonadales bacterium]